MAIISDIVAPLRGSKRRVVHLDGCEWRLTSMPALQRAGLRAALVADETEIARRLDEAEPVAARERALRLLAYRERSAGEVFQRLVDDGYPTPVATAVTERLVESGLVDDERFAHVSARVMAQVRGYGADRILRELAARGVDGQLARDAVDAALPADEERRVALELARALARRPGASVERVAARLVRRGYRPSLALDAARGACSSSGCDTPSGADGYGS